MSSGIVARVRSFLRGLRGGRALDAGMEQEFRAHMELRADDLVKDGFAPDVAMRRARMEFGLPERYVAEARRSRGLGILDSFRFSWIDVVLGWRMLAKYPGITIVGGLAMAFAIWVGAATFEIVTQALHPTLPLPDGGRIVAIRNRDVASNRVESHALHDFELWRGQLRTVTELGAYREVERNLVAERGEGEPARVAEITASAFRVARAAALLGRALVAADERADAPPVLVLGHELWTRRFGADPGVVGRTVKLGQVSHTIVGVMPRDYAFPVAHELWVPLRLSATGFARREGPVVQVFGLLAPGATLDEARAELQTLGRRTAVEWRNTHEHMRPEIMWYAESVLDTRGLGAVIFASANIPLVMLLVLVCGNVALLMFARAATRESEIVVRNALGATRGRVVAQLFAEALVLGGVAAIVGIAAAGFGLRWLINVIEGEGLNGGRLPFWFSARLSPTTILYAIGLTVLGAAIAGILPARKVTRGLGARLKEATAGGGGLQFGGVWTLVIVAQIAVTVAFPVTALLVKRDEAQIADADVGFPDREYLSLRIEMDAEGTSSAPRTPLVGRPTLPPQAGDSARNAFRARFTASWRELERRLLADPAVVGVTFGDRLPRMYHPYRLIEVDAGGAAPLDPQWPSYRVSSAAVDPRFFGVLDVPVRLGRAFHPADLTAGASAVVVNESFVRRVLGGRNPIGRRLRYVHYEEWERDDRIEPGPWYEIVGVVPDMGMAIGADVGQDAGADPKVSGIYHPAPPGAVYPARVAVHVRGDPMAFAPRMRAHAAAANPGLRLYDLRPLADVNEGELQFLQYWFRLLVTVSVMALTLSLAGIYAVMSFTVSRRTREIGIRIALGADRRRLVLAIFRRPLLQVSLGIVAGAGIVTFLIAAYNSGALPARQLALLGAYALLMFGVCLLACIVPTRRALNVEPTEALRADG